MLSQRMANIAFALAALLAVAYFVNVTLSFDESGLHGASELSSAFFPLAALGFIAVCALIVLAKYLLAATEDGRKQAFVFLNGREAFSGAMTFGVASLCLVVWSHFGFVTAAIIMGPAAALAMRVRSVYLYGVLGVIGYAIYLVFRYLLGVQLG